MMECAAKGRGSACSPVGPPMRLCGICGAVAYCSKSHQMLHWNDHKEDCPRLAKQMRNADVLNDFPFTFSMEAAVLRGTRCSILTSMGLHRIGLWKSECSCAPSSSSSKTSWIINNWDLPSSLCPCSEPASPVSTCMNSWKDYYQWRGLPLHSPVALLLHWPLTIYHCFQVSGIQSLIPGVTNRLNIHYLGPEKELLQLGVSGELRALFPRDVQLHMDFIGPAVPQFRDKETLKLPNYMYCSEEGCSCTGSSTGLTNDKTSVTIKLHKGFYHEIYGDIMKESYPHLVVSLNAGVAAYSSWLPTIVLLKEIGIPVVFTDFCEEAAHLGARCLSAATGQALRIPVQLNPFRQPLVVEESALYLPCYSNCFLFGM